jgi:hypothetical protein
MGLVDGELFPGHDERNEWVGGTSDGAPVVYSPCGGLAVVERSV